MEITDKKIEITFIERQIDEADDIDADGLREYLFYLREQLPANQIRP